MVKMLLRMSHPTGRTSDQEIEVQFFLEDKLYKVPLIALLQDQGLH